MRTKALRACLSQEKDWCGRPDLNRHSAFAPRDFRTCYGFRRPSLPRRGVRLGLGSGLYLHRCARSPALGAARLVSTPSPRSCGRCAWLGIACDRFPRVWAVLHPGFPREHSKNSSPLRLPISPRPRTPIYNLGIDKSPIRWRQKQQRKSKAAAPHRCTAVSRGEFPAGVSAESRISPCRCAPRPRPISVRSGRSHGRPSRRTCSGSGRSRASARPLGTKPNADCPPRAR
jgi:hypothetical protein